VPRPRLQPHRLHPATEVLLDARLGRVRAGVVVLLANEPPTERGRPAHVWVDPGKSRRCGVSGIAVDIEGLELQRAGQLGAKTVGRRTLEVGLHFGEPIRLAHRRKRIQSLVGVGHSET
jgi:hypothetical protein